MRRIAVLGSTGSIGMQTLDVARRHPDKIEIVALAAGRRASEVFEQAKEFNVRTVALGEEPNCEIPDGIDVTIGPKAVAELVDLNEVDVVVNALVGAAGLREATKLSMREKCLPLPTRSRLSSAAT